MPRRKNTFERAGGDEVPTTGVVSSEVEPLAASPEVDPRGLAPDEQERMDRATNIMLMDMFWPEARKTGGLVAS